MDIQTRKMARMPREVKDEIFPFFNDVFAIPTETSQKIIALDEEWAEFVQHGLKVDSHHFQHQPWWLGLLLNMFVQAYRLLVLRESIAAARYTQISDFCIKLAYSRTEMIWI